LLPQVSQVAMARLLVSIDPCQDATAPAVPFPV
jgi:hypothetical protein